MTRSKRTTILFLTMTFSSWPAPSACLSFKSKCSPCIKSTLRIMMHLYSSRSVSSFTRMTLVSNPMRSSTAIWSVSPRHTTKCYSTYMIREMFTILWKKILCTLRMSTMACQRCIVSFSRKSSNRCRILRRHCKMASSRYHRKEATHSMKSLSCTSSAPMMTTQSTT